MIDIDPDVVKVPCGATNYPVTVSDSVIQAVDSSLGNLRNIKMNPTLTPVSGGSALSASNVAVDANGNFSHTVLSVPIGASRGADKFKLTVVAPSVSHLLASAFR